MLEQLPKIDVQVEKGEEKAIPIAAIELLAVTEDHSNVKIFQD